MKSLHGERNRQEENERAIERHSNEGTFKSGSLTCARQARLTDKGERWWEGCWASCEFWAGDKPTWLGTNTTEKKCTGGNSKKKVVIRLTWRLEQRLVGTVRSGDQVRFGLMLNWRAHKSHSPSPLQWHASRISYMCADRRLERVCRKESITACQSLAGQGLGASVLVQFGVRAIIFPFTFSTIRLQNDVINRLEHQNDAWLANWARS